ncbi:DAK1/DegV-like protein [Pseudovirgaria hyperparasitica]|uniref:DAK1/DegV-like protein n=1 Tax=Pseudovirgaria hyperparasitica TaxID=470096 RepID=A0A6A6WLW7_9PEZI|nr:DAK1/DegV-like protein [Pseudovirgaria hyperparasitica]KAF2763009.1 DAK1/DegV-like protein [Pseudovirgaria hyperparasitica]
MLLPPHSALPRHPCQAITGRRYSLTHHQSKSSHKHLHAIMATAEATPAPAAKETFHLINDPSEAINEAMSGLTTLHPTLSYSAKHKITYRSDIATFRENHVTTIGFAGGGHEPMFTGFVGPSYLTCAVSGTIFASPTAAQILAAIALCQPHPATSPGTLLVCGNYTGDILNAGLAVTRAQALGYRVRFVPVGDDVAVGRAQGGRVGRRGLAGHLVALKVVCGMADEGVGLEEVGRVMEGVVGDVGTVGVGFDRVGLPTGVVGGLPVLPGETVELGMGAHGEPGLERMSPVPLVGELVGRMVGLLTDVGDGDRGFIPFEKARYGDGEEGADNAVVLVVNSLGSTGDGVLAVFAGEGVRELRGRGFRVERVVMGPLVTSLKMSGVGMTVWRLPVGEGVLGAAEALRLWDRRVDVVAWRQ